MAKRNRLAVAAKELDAVKAQAAVAAVAAYGRNVEAIKGLRVDLGFLLAKHEEKAAAEPRNWGFAGDLDLIKARLEECVRFLNGGELVDPARRVYPVRTADGRVIGVTIPEDEG